MDSLVDYKKDMMSGFLGGINFTFFSHLSSVTVICTELQGIK